MTQEETSPAKQLLEHVWNNCRRRSWLGLNTSLSTALSLAISSGMRFDVNDFDDFHKERPEGFRAGYWIGADDEWCYTLACGARGVRNLSAARSYEKMKGRLPFKIKGRRVFVRARLTYNDNGIPLIGEVTSFNDEKETLTLIARARDYSKRDGDGSGDRRVERRLSLTRTVVGGQCSFL